MKKRFIVTGGLGFIGSNLIELLLKKNHYVINIDIGSYSSNSYNTKDFDKNKNYKLIKCNIGEKNKIKKIFNKYRPNGIFNLAAETHVDRSIENPKIFFLSNVISLIDFLEVFKDYCKTKKNIKLIHISTDEVYGDIIKGRTTEKSKYYPSSPYAASKASSDHLVSSYIKTFNLPCIITNCSNNYGPKQHPEKLIPKLIYNIINNKNLPIYGTGKNSREWIYVKDHCDALIKIYYRGKIGEFYNIGSNKNLSNLDITKRLIKISKKFNKIGKNVKIKFVKDRPGHDLRYALNSKKIRKNFNWTPKTNINKGLEISYLWYLQNTNYYKNIKKKYITKRIGLIK